MTLSIKDRDRALLALRGLFQHLPDLKIIVIFEDTGDISVASDVDINEVMKILKHMSGMEPIEVSYVEGEEIQ